MASTDCNSRKKRKKNRNPEIDLLVNLQSCSKSKDLTTAISLYDSGISQNIRINQHHFSILLYICAASVTDPSSKSLAIERGFRIFDHMVSSGMSSNEASITSVARLAAAKGDGDYAFALIKDLVANGGLPRLRTYSPALLYFCENLEDGKAYEVEEHMDRMNVSLEEAEMAALLKVSAEVGKEERVYRYLHKLRGSVRCVSKETAKIIENWFSGEKGSAVGNGVEYSATEIREAVSKTDEGGMGWVGWPGSGTKNSFPYSLNTLLKDWVEKHAPYEAIVDGANIGLYRQNFADGGFSIPQLDAVVKEMYCRSGNKWPLVILHDKRLRGLLENPSCRKVVEEWMDNGVVYKTPHGSNDDWYWLYAAVKLRCLLVTNDEMRDHIFELLGSSFFLKWKERHQVRYTFPKGSLKLQMPSPYSLAIQVKYINRSYGLVPSFLVPC
ncbi:proteinaceous RNase P 2 [Carica papaya]|uniref:proteinaceous RNase P 2 n=1 Tax=Carica papaya TaxID=3649 RepID=UPI000B8CE660|nr:proteinaceous RNase P 2 [Carica papaya]